MPVPAVLSPPSLSSVQRGAWRAEHYISQAVTAHPPALSHQTGGWRYGTDCLDENPPLPSLSTLPFLSSLPPPLGLLEPKTVEISEQPRRREAGRGRIYHSRSLHVASLAIWTSGFVTVCVIRHPLSLGRWLARGWFSFRGRESKKKKRERRGPREERLGECLSSPERLGQSSEGPISEAGALHVRAAGDTYQPAWTCRATAAQGAGPGLEPAHGHFRDTVPDNKLSPSRPSVADYFFSPIYQLVHRV